MDNLSGKDVSLWIDTTPETHYPSLDVKNIECDVAIVGGGITGLLTAWYLQNEGLNVVIVEKSRIVESTTGNTTAKLTSQHYLIYDYLIKEKGIDVARSYAAANQNAIDEIENISIKLGIDCDFSRRNAYVFTENKDKVHLFEKEVQATKSIGLPSSFETTTDLPFKIECAIKFSNQAQFHPRKFLLDIAGELTRKKVRIFENTKVIDIIPGPANILETENGQIKAKYIVQATRYPFWKPEIFKGAVWHKISYDMGVYLVDNSKYPQGMYINIDEPSRTIRSHPYKNGQIMIFGGESHKIGGGGNDEYFKNIISDLNTKFDVKKVVYKWIASDVMSHDRMPYIGKYPNYPDIYVATGYSAWGLAWGTAAAKIISNQIMARPDPWAKPFGLQRLKP
jgi:glycine/D-amino acid oxidase-like deaminating enzyme